MNIIPGGITAPKGFKAAGIHCGVKDNHSLRRRTWLWSSPRFPAPQQAPTPRTW